MARYVDADKIKDSIDEWLDCVGFATVGKGMSYYYELIGCVEDTETANVQEVKHGKWVDVENIIEYHCSECGAEAPNDGYDNGANYCYNCGAKMDGDSE